MASLHVARLAAISSYLFPVAAPRKIPHPNCSPAQFCHHFCQTPERARSSVALWHFKQVQQRLGADTLQVIKKVDLAAHALQREPPGIGRSAAAALAASSRIFSRNDSALNSGLPVV